MTWADVIVIISIIGSWMAGWLVGTANERKKWIKAMPTGEERRQKVNE